MKRGHGSGRLAGDSDGAFPNLPPSGSREHPSQQSHTPTSFHRRLLLLLLLAAVACTGPPGAASKPALLEPCASATACPTLFSSALHADLKLAELAVLFAVDPLAILAANAIDFAAPGLAGRILPVGLALRVPVPCACSGRVRRATSVRYRLGDTLSRVYDGLTAPDWIRDSNGGVLDAEGAVDAGTALLVLLHCACFGRVGNGDTVPAIAKRYQTTTTDVMSGCGSDGLAGDGDGAFLDKLRWRGRGRRAARPRPAAVRRQRPVAASSSTKVSRPRLRDPAGEASSGGAVEP
ncbi:lysM domain-containing GPI-anchored protein LYP4-like [Triticum aestivum]|uniref:lysM domain-containing GPI-anchored protein LYP4-like n=1 Tax=Triticum aestivum TaxID=4565 RepID=UPI001D019B9F|nr:lysM domain-containing GPI-anchored protein LYP4-like [Triticum aestivum]